MATITVKDAAGTDQTVEKPNANGRVAATASRPVVLSTEDLAALTALATKLDTLIGNVDGLETTATSELAATNLVGTRGYGTAVTKLAYTGTSAQSGAITGTEVLVHNCGTGRCYIKAASSPTATTDDIPIETGEKFHLRITSGHKIAAIQDSVGGNLNIVPVA